MSLLRRRMMMQGQETIAKYPFKNGEKILNGITITVTNGNHVRIDKPIFNILINISDITANINFNGFNESRVNITGCYISDIPQAANVKFIIKNISDRRKSIFSLFLKDVQGNTIPGSNMTERIEKEDPNIITLISSDVKLGCVGVWIATYKLEKGYLEFDVELYVNEERWI